MQTAIPRNYARHHRTVEVRQKAISNWKNDAISLDKAVLVLPTVYPTSRSQAPYTIGCRKTKSKIKWGANAAGTEPSTVAVKHSMTLQTAYQSQWYDKRGETYVLKAKDSYVYQYFPGSDRREYVCQFVDDGLVWLIPLSHETEQLQHRVLKFLGIGQEIENVQNVQLERSQLIKPITSKRREAIAKRGKKIRSASRPGKRERAAMKQIEAIAV